MLLKSFTGNLEISIKATTFYEVSSTLGISFHYVLGQKEKNCLAQSFVPADGFALKVSNLEIPSK